jgi:tetratricopeptide (TPR) repeat protein
MKQGRWTKQDGALVLTVLIGLACVVGLSRWIDSHRPIADSSLAEENLYLNAATVNRASLGFKGLAADWYWMRALQYVGRKIINVPEDVQLDNLGQLNLKLLAPLLDASTTLDPQFMEPYQYAAVVLPAVDVDEAIRIIKKGIAANPSTWRLYNHLGYIYWQQHDFKAAGETYAQGAKLPGAPAWMEAMRARMAAEGGSRDTAREIYTRMFEEAGESKVKEMARKRIMQVDSMDERDALRRLMAAYKSRMGRCPASWREMEGVLRALRVRVDSEGAPLDPAGTAYLLVKNKCEVDLDWKSEVPSK